MNNACLSPDGQRIAASIRGQSERKIVLWDANTGQRVRTITDGPGLIHRLSFSPDSRHLAAGGISAGRDSRTSYVGPGLIKVLDAAGGEVLSEFQNVAGIHCIQLSPDGTKLAVANNSLTTDPADVGLWNVMQGKLIHTLIGSRGPVYDVCFTPDGKRLASCGFDQAVHIWNVLSGELLPNMIRAHDERVTAVRYSPDGLRIATASLDKSVKIWDSATGDEVLALKGHRRGVRSVCFSPDGARLIVCDGSIQIRETTGFPAAQSSR